MSDEVENDPKEQGEQPAPDARPSAAAQIQISREEMETIVQDMFGFMAEFGEVIQQVEKNPTEAEEILRAFIAQKTDNTELPLTKPQARLQVAFELFGQWRFKCGTRGDKLQDEVRDLIDELEVVSDWYAENAQRYLAIIRECDALNERSPESVARKWDSSYRDFIEKMNAADEAGNVADAVRWQHEAKKQLGRFWDNLRQAEKRLGVYRKVKPKQNAKGARK